MYCPLIKDSCREDCIMLIKVNNEDKVCMIPLGFNLLQNIYFSMENDVSEEDEEYNDALID